MHPVATRFAQFGLLALLAAATGCIAAAADELDPEDLEQGARQDAPIIGGSTATAYPESALVDMYQNGQMTSACSGAVIAPKVVLTAGHCVYGFNGWKITTPFANGQKANASSAATYDWKVSSEYVDPNYHDVALIFLDTPITLSSYPTIANSMLSAGSQIVNIGRIDNGSFSNTKLFVSKPISVSDGKSYGYPYDYVANEVIQSGDSGGPDMLAGTHTIVAVNSGAGGGTEVLARVDLLSAWIKQQVDAHGGSGNSGNDPPPPPPPSGVTETEPNDSYQSPNTLGAAVSGKITGGDQDWFTWSVSAANVPYDLRLTPTGDAQIQMWKYVSGSYYPVANTTPTDIAHSSTGAGKYVVVVWSPSGQSQTYKLTLKK